MPVDLSQSSRLGKLHSPFGANNLVLLRMDGTDLVDGLFEYRIEALSMTANLNFDDGIGQNISVEVNTHNHGKKWFDGILTEAQWLGVHEGGHLYRLVLRPWFWLAENRRNQRIFHEKTVADILDEVLSEYPGPHMLELTRSYPTLEYTVQFAESDMAFLQRLLSRHGISYHFQAEKGSHTMVLTDSHDGFKPIDGGTRKVVLVDDQHVSEDEHFSSFSALRKLTTGRIVTTDYNFKTPSAAMEADQTGDANHSHGQIESFDYPGNYPDQAAGKEIARRRMQQTRSADNRFTAQGDLISLSAGQKVTLEGHPDDALNGKDYVALRCMFSYVSEGYTSGTMASGGDSFQGNYEFVETSTPYGPPLIQTTQKMAGIQTAKVVGAGEIDCDEHGRILVKFHWDMKGANSVRCRVAQMWAGAGFGSMHIPRVGMEVVVQFVDGDPDRPLVTGCVYNAENTPPYGLPGSKNIAGIKSNTTEGGGGYNEFVLDDTAGNELIRQHAQFDMETKVLNDERRNVDVNRTTNIGNDETSTIGHDETHTVANNRTTSVGVDEVRTVGGNETHTIAQNSTNSFGMNVTNTIGTNLTNTVGATAMMTVAQAMVTTVGLSSALNVGAGREVGVGQGRVTQIGSDDDLNVGKKFELKAGSEIKLVVGSSSIEMTATKIKITSPTVEVSASKEFKSKSGMFSKHSAGGLMDIKGSLVKINS